MISKISMVTIVVVGGAVGIGVGVTRRLPTAVAVARVRVAWKRTLLTPINIAIIIIITITNAIFILNIIISIITTSSYHCC